MAQRSPATNTSLPATIQHHDFAVGSSDDSDTDSKAAADGEKRRSNTPGKDESLPLADEPPPYSNGRRRSFVDQDAARVQPELPEPAKNKMVGWRDLPHKRQLAILTMARLCEPLVQTSIQSYMFFQLQSFDRSLPDSKIAAQVGVLQGSFTAAQFLTGMLWGRMSDADWGGRKKVLLVGLTGTLVSSVGFGFSQTYWQALIFRTVGGGLNGNVGVMRTMISEIIKEKKYQARAFLILPMCFNIGVIIGPILGGLLADPANSYPGIFGHVRFFQRFPYAPPNLLNAVLLLIVALAVFLGLEETLESIRHEDLGSKCGRKLKDLFKRYRGRNTSSDHAYMPIDADEQSRGLLDNGNLRSEDIEMSPVGTKDTKATKKKGGPRYKQKLPFRRIFTAKILWTFLAHFVLGCHVGTFNNLWFIFLSTPVADPASPELANYKQHLPFVFTGGLGMPARDVGLAMAVLGVIGITLQLLVYPRVNARLGVIRSWRMSLYFFPVAYILAPYLAVVPSKSPPPAEKDGFLLWLALSAVLFVQVLGRTFALPATIILLNNSSPHPSVLGTIHGLGQSVGSAARTIGPVLAGWIYGVGLSHGVVGAAWWGLSGVALCGCVASRFVSEGDGHEIRLEGDDEAEAEFQAEVAAAVSETRR
ncbi:MAG: hypothetical protein M1818_002755 [Claussenomyces sp. TS43310]|nr:MAG: hypothetical protein M1818_002755 [Claussenomyces sp. TS43310]